MSDEILSKTLGDVLRRLETRGEEEEAQIKIHQERQHWQKEKLQQAEHRKQRVKEQIERSTQELDVLRVFISSQQSPSRALSEQFAIIEQQQRHLMSEMQSATDHTHSMRAEYEHVTGQLTGAEQKRKDTQREWDKISEQITRISLQRLTTESS